MPQSFRKVEKLPALSSPRLVRKNTDRWRSPNAATYTTCDCARICTSLGYIEAQHVYAETSAFTSPGAHTGQPHLGRAKSTWAASWPSTN